MEVLCIDHFTLRVRPDVLPVLREFYTRVLGLREGPRPDFPFPGHWFYAGGAAVVHLAGNEPEESGQAGGDAALSTGRFNHVSLRTRGLAATRAHLAKLGVPWEEAPVPGVPLHQVFLHDPVGLKIELTFDAAELDSAGKAA